MFKFTHLHNLPVAEQLAFEFNIFYQEIHGVKPISTKDQLRDAAWLRAQIKELDAISREEEQQARAEFERMAVITIGKWS